ncbi:MAG: response regulator [Promethearchaeota archaeon]
MSNILIVDDDLDIVDLFEQFLKLKGHKIIAKAYDGEQAIEVFKKSQNHIDIIIMDHRMPLKNGVETTEEILNINPKVKIIFVSADYTIRDRAIKAGAVDFLEKPIDFDTLFRLIEKYIPS